MTANPDPTDLIGHSLFGAAPFTESLLIAFQHCNPGEPAPAAGPHTTEIMLTVEIPEDDENLFALDHASAAGMGFTFQDNVDAFIKLGGGTPGHWYVYLGDMPASYIYAEAETGL